tara:strand:- start:788 stop:2185 length:1398 start_codon:yes stop_codon:yes gene_type:complete
MKYNDKSIKYNNKTNKNREKKTNKKTKKMRFKDNKNQSKKQKKRATGFFLKKNKTVIPKTMLKNTVVIKDETPVEDRLISKSIQKILVDKKKPSNMLSTIREELTKNKSFTPEINKKLVSMSLNTGFSDIFDCGLNTPLQNKKFKPNVSRNDETLFKNIMQVKIGVKNKNPICVDRNDPRAQKLLLKNLNSTSAIDCSKIITPLQVRANCWFNTMFVCFFISDKGRKFFKFFRQLMIQGKLANGSKITPSTLADSFFLFNAAIEACYNSSKNKKAQDLALAMDTNNIITRIYNAIPKKNRNYGILDVDSPNNPLNYYDDVMRFLNNDNINLVEIDYVDIKNISQNGGNFGNKIPDVYAITMIDKTSKNINDKPLTIKLHGVDYVLDSVIIRDTEMYHFCALITCGGNELGFDGASMSRLNKFEWKKNINKDINWTFEGSNFNEDKKDPILWNFRQAYQILFYYRK